MRTGHARHLVYLLITVGPDAGKKLFLQPKQEALLGRVSHANLRLNDPSCSGRHCMVRSVGDMVFIEDLKSKNGTRVNGEPVSTRVLDEDGEIVVGTNTIRLTFLTSESDASTDSDPTGVEPTRIEVPTVRKSTDTNLQSIGGLPTLPDHSSLAEFHAARSMLGRNIGGYSLLELAGIGGLGVVYRAKCLEDREQAAVKLIRKDDARSPEALQRFMSRTEVGLVVPGAVQLRITGEDGAYCFIAMEYAKGRGVQTVMDLGNRCLLENVLSWLEPLGKTFQAIHDRNLVHGDIRPANIVVTEDGQVTLLDLGMAHKLDREGRFILNRKDELFLRLPYMAPEVSLQRNDVDRRADIYALGASLWAALIGRPPFMAKKQIDLVRKIRWEDPVLASDIRKEIPIPVAKVLTKAMEKEAGRRFATIEEMIGTLKAVVE